MSLALTSQCTSHEAVNVMREGVKQMELRMIPHSSAKGFTLLESLIALVIFSVALLALAGMYAKTLSMSHSTYLRALASIQAMDLEERIRVNPRADMNDYVFACAGPNVAASSPFPISGDPATLAGQDQQDWCALTKNVFGNLYLAAEVAVDASSPVDYLISIEWSERSIQEDNSVSVTGEQFIYTVRK